MRRLAVFICSFGYVGFFPIAPGTAGSAAGLAVYLLVSRLHSSTAEMALIVVMFVVGVILGGKAEQALGGIDPGPVVLDEVLGMLLTLWLIPVNWVGMILGFLVFRVFDIVKPFPARQLERLPGGLGMMADDAMAAIYGNLLMHAVFYLAPALVS